ncbi:MAG: hypothetical protein SynsKO_14300 [Synoicihabitans sp.]
MSRFRQNCLISACLGIGGLAGFAADSVNEITADDLAFFESEIRPLLIENCYECHSVGAERVRGGFLLDSRPGMLRGGDSGRVVVPFAAEESRLVNMVRHHPDFEAMPPKTKLTDQQIESLITWIDRGAPDPRIEEPEHHGAESEFDLEARKEWWSLQPVADLPPPAVRDETWPNTPYDQFILAVLEDKGWSPAPDAEPHTLLRRLSFDLTGLPPTPAELEAFLSDPSPDAYLRQVDRLLASPHFGEKWARHWMDLTRYAETKAFEMDYTMPFAYRYRDYLIRAFNADVPYDQFIREALAGDLLKHPRIDPVTGDNESIKGPGFLFLSDGQHGPPDIHEDEARVFARTIDVTTKAFLGSTVACARCHDHKFDAITTADYYSLYGILRSSRITHANAVSTDRQTAPAAQIKHSQAELEPLIYAAIKPHIDAAADYLATRDELLDHADLQSKIAALEEKYSGGLNAKRRAERAQDFDQVIQEFSAENTPAGLDAAVLGNWLKLAVHPDSRKNWPELTPFVPAASQDAKPQKAAGKDNPRSASFDAIAASLDDWMTEGPAFLETPAPGSLLISSTEAQTALGLTEGPIFAGHRGARMSGVIRSPDFVLDGKPIRFQAKGRLGRVRLVVRNYELAGRGPTTAVLAHSLNGDHWQDITIPTYLWEGEPAYLEIVHHGDFTQARHPREEDSVFDEDAYIAVRFAPATDWPNWWSNRDPVDQLQQTWSKARDGNLASAENDLMSAVLGAGLVNAGPDSTPSLHQNLTAYREAAKQIPLPRYVRSLTEGDPQNTPVYIRGSHKNLSQEPNPRRFLDAFGGEVFNTSGSGRIEWAQSVADPTNPLTTRVIVNRLWHHVFGQGLVPTVNDFGVMSTPPSHPELLDFLAQDLVRNDWSLKSLIRQMVLSRAYQMATTPSAVTQAEDPANRLLQHMPIKRLDAEAVRDHILASSGSLDRTMFGPSVPAYVKNLPDSRAKPPVNGPLNGDNRRSVYLEMRRNFLPTFLRAFDLPNATEPVGVRHATNVPAQSLALMNDPFVHEQAKHWASRITASDSTQRERINQVHLTAFSRPATDAEQAWAQSVLNAMATAHGTTPENPAPWADLCHLIFNRKEFIYLL